MATLLLRSGTAAASSAGSSVRRCCGRSSSSFPTAAFAYPTWSGPSTKNGLMSPSAVSTYDASSPRVAWHARSYGRRTSQPTALFFDRHFSTSVGDALADDERGGRGRGAATAPTVDSRKPLTPYFPHVEEYSMPPPVDGEDWQPQLRRGQRVVAFGDVHGDRDALKKFLVTAKIMAPHSDIEDPLWVGGDTICVQTGDILDRGDDELLCLRCLASLSRQARKAGGHLLMLFGNHEALNSAGLFHYANPGGNAEFESFVGQRIDYVLGSNRWRLQFAGNEPSRWVAFEPGGLLADALLKHMYVAVVIGRSVFVHAGLTADHVKEYGGIQQMNKAARDWVVTAHHGDNNNDGTYETVEQVIAAAQERAKKAASTMPGCLGGGIGATSPVWMRDYSQPNDRAPKNPVAQSMIDDTLSELGNGVQRMVMGHTPQMQINSALKGKAWRIDVGASQGVMGGTPEVLEIIHCGGDNDEDLVSVLTVDGKQIKGQERIAFDSLL